MERLICSIIVFVIGCNCIIAQENIPSPEELLKNVSAISDIPGLDKINASALPSLEDTMTSFQKKCEKNGGPEAFERVNRAKDDMAECAKTLVNFTQLEKEMNHAKPTGDLDTVFKKYCHKSPLLKACVNNFTNALQYCLEPQEQENIKIIQNITENLINFICFKDGDRIALFIAAEGPECFKEKQSAVQECINSTFGSYVPVPDANSGVPNIVNLPLLLFGVKECTDFAKLQDCTVKELEGCKDPTPANIADSLFTFVKKSTPCNELLKNVKSAITARTAYSSAHTYVGSLSIILLSFSLRII